MNARQPNCHLKSHLRERFVKEEVKEKREREIYDKASFFLPKKNCATFNIAATDIIKHPSQIR